MKEYSCSDGHEFDANESKEEWFGMKVCPHCWPNGLPRKSPGIVEWGGTLRCRTSDGRTVNMADELNRLEREKESEMDKRKN